MAQTVKDHVARVAEGLLNDAEAMLAEMNAAIFETAPVLASDATIEAETVASTRANMLRWLAAMATHPAEPVRAPVGRRFRVRLVEMISGPAPSRDVCGGFLSSAILNHENMPTVAAILRVGRRGRAYRVATSR